MPNIENEGNFQMKIIQATYKETPKDDDPNAFCVSLKGETADGLHAWATLYFSNHKIQNGKYAGMTMFEKGCQTLKEIGVKDGYLGNLESAVKAGLYAEFVMRYEDDGYGNLRLRCKYINKKSSEVDIAKVDFTKIMQAYQQIEAGQQQIAQQTQPATAPASNPAPQTAQAQPVQAGQAPAPAPAPQDNGFLMPNNSDGDVPPF